MTKPIKYILILISIASLLMVGYWFYVLFIFDPFDGPIYYKEDLIENFEKKKVEILDLKEYIGRITPKNTYVDIEFEDDNHLFFFHITKPLPATKPSSTPYGKGTAFAQHHSNTKDYNYNLTIGSLKSDSLLNYLGWTDSNLKSLKNKLDLANCISVSTERPVTIGWQRSGLGLFSYKIFDNNLNDSLITQYNDSCTYIFYKDNVVLEYGGGAIGPQCFARQ